MFIKDRILEFQPYHQIRQKNESEIEKIEVTRPADFREKRFYDLFLAMNFWKTLDTETIEFLQIFGRFLKRPY